MHYSRATTFSVLLAASISALPILLTASDTAAQETTHTVTDVTGREVTIPNELNNIALTHGDGILGVVAMMNSVDNVSSMVSTEYYQWFRKMYPVLQTIPDYGGFENVNVEEILRIKPDIVIAPSRSEEVNRKMMDLGLTVYIEHINNPYEGKKEALRLAGEVFQQQEKAQALIRFWDEMTGLVHERVKDIPEAERKRVFIMRRTIEETHNKTMSSSDMVIAAGGINVGAEAGPGFKINLEDVVLWNPDYIIQVVRLPNNADYYNELRADPKINNIKAIKDGNMMPIPMGFGWWYYGFTEGGIGVLWLAKTLYPEHFADIDFESTVKSFYKDFYNLDLKQEDYDLLFANFNNFN